MENVCCIKNCTTTNLNVGTFFYRFPTKEKILHSWFRAILEQTGQSVFREEDEICSKHFSTDCFIESYGVLKLKDSAVPFGEMTETEEQNAPKRIKTEKTDVQIQCSVLSCSNIQRETDQLNSNIIYYPFPTDSDLAQNWKNFCNKIDDDFDNSYICTEHFGADDFVNSTGNILKQNAMPTIYRSEIKIEETEIQYENPNLFSIMSYQNENPIPDVTSSSTIIEDTNMKPSISTVSPGPSTIDGKRDELSEMEKQRADYSLIKMLVEDFQPLSIVENKHFLEYSYNLHPLYKVPNQSLLLNNMLPAKYQEIKLKVHGILQEVSYVAATTDMWSSDNNKTFFALTSHFIFDNKLQSALLSVNEIPEGKTANNIANTISTILEEWNISTKLVTIVTNDDPNIKKAVENLKISRHPCVAHTLNLCVTDAIKETTEFSGLLKTCRSFVAHLRQNAVASENLKQIQREMGLPELELKQDVPTRWNSSLVMLDNLLELKQPISTVITSLPNVKKLFKTSQWDIIRDCTSILRPLELMTKELSAKKYVTMSSIIPLIRGLQSTITNQATITYCGCHLKTALLEILRERLAILEMDKVCARATFLDARFKTVVFSNPKNGDNAKIWIADEISVNEIQSNCTTSTNVNEETGVKVEREKVSLWSFMQEVKAKNATTDVPSVTVNRSVEQYLSMGRIDLSQDPLEFWNRNEKMLPELFQLSQKYLCIPANSVPAERIFSQAGQIMNERRNRLKGETLNQILFLNSNLEL